MPIKKSERKPADTASSCFPVTGFTDGSEVARLRTETKASMPVVPRKTSAVQFPLLPRLSLRRRILVTPRYRLRVKESLFLFSG